MEGKVLSFHLLLLLPFQDPTNVSYFLSFPSFTSYSHCGFFLVAFDHAITFSVFGRWAPLWLHISSRLRLASSSHSQPNCSPSTFFFTHDRMACDANVLLKLLLVGFEATLMTPNSMGKHKVTFYGTTSPHLSLLTHPFLILPWLL